MSAKIKEAKEDLNYHKLLLKQRFMGLLTTVVWMIFMDVWFNGRTGPFENHR